MQNLLDAARLAAAGYPGGLPVLCARMAWNYETARKELAGAPGFKLGAQRLGMLSELCMEAGGENCDAVLNAFNGNHGQVRPLPGTDDAGSMNDRIASVMKEVSDVVRAHAVAMSDGQYSANDVKSMDREVLEAIAALLSISDGAQADNKRASLRVVP